NPDVDPCHPPRPPGPITEEFVFSGAAENWVVPSGVCLADVEAVGAEGGDGDGGAAFAAGGQGGRGQGVLAVQPGDTLRVRVGGQGEPGERDTDDGGA